MYFILPQLYNQQIQMSFARCCKQCICWALFAVSTVIMLIMLSLALNDMSMILANQALLEHIINTSVPQLNCLDVCQVWYTQESNGLCCDRYNMDLCAKKDDCKKDYIKNNQIAVDILDNDKFHQFLVAAVCSLILIMIAFRKGKKQSYKKIEPEIDPKMIEITKKTLEDIREEKKLREESPQHPTFGSSYHLNNSPTKIEEASFTNDFPVHVSQMLNDNINCPELNLQVKNHACEHCSKDSNKQ